MAEINIEMLKEKLYPVAKALFIISEILVDESKSHISKEDALVKICSYMHDADVICSRSRVDRLIEDCMEPTVSNVLDDQQVDWLKKYLEEQPLQKFEISYPSCCDSCSNNPKNGGSGICNCTIPYFSDHTLYSTNASIDDCCMTATMSTGAYIFGKEKPNADKQPKANANRIAEAVERTKKYIKEQCDERQVYGVRLP